MTHDSRVLIWCLWLALVACVAMLSITQVRGVAAEDDCLEGTAIVKRLPDLFGGGLVCVREPAR